MQAVSEKMRSAMSDWFGDPQRPMFNHRMDGGEDDATWQLAVVNNVADHWGIQVRGLNSVYLVATMDRDLAFRRYWTSNR